ncbi:hypothetical protein F4808DRAFT_412785 [Astrocystis sublimbata]|nr:hypothetical protein F4808DRAFT_412785 [Astrocystis sublimbata]
MSSSADNQVNEAPTGSVQDDSYVKRQGDNAAIDVVKDDADIEDPVSAENADSDQQLDKDDKDAIDSSNIIKSRLRGNEPKEGAMAEPSDEEMGLGEDE